MKQFLLTGLTALMLLGTSFTGRADDSTLVQGYTEDFTTLYKGATSGNMSRSSYGYPVKYWIREGVTTKNLAVNGTYNHGSSTTNRCIGYSVANQGSGSNQSEILITPKVGGDITFYVHRSISSTTSSLQSEIELFNMTVDDGGTWTRSPLSGISGVTTSGVDDITTSLVGNNMTDWKEVKIMGVPDGTRIGIRLNGLFIDDFSASKAWLEWPSYVWDGTIIPYIDVTPLGTTYTKYYLDADNNLLDSEGKPFTLEVQLKQTVYAGKPTEDMFKYRFQFSVTGQSEPLRLTDANGNDIIAEFNNRPTSDWTSLSNGDISHEEQTIEFALYNLDPKYFNTNTSFQAVKVGPDGQDVGSPISMQRKNTVATDGTWNATSWSNFQFEALIPQPIIVYSTTVPTATTTASSWKGNTLSEYHPWFINPISNEAPIYMINIAGRASMEIESVTFDNEAFGLLDNPTFPITVTADGLYNLKPCVKATQPGIYKGKMTVKVKNDDTEYVALLEGAVKPNYDTKYLFHNENGTNNATMPEGWLATGNWQIANLTAAQQKVDGKWTQAASTYGTTPANVILSSPKMQFEQGAEIWFDATCYQLTGEMSVLYSKDRSNWQVLKTMTVGPVTPTDANPLTEDNFNTFFTSKSTYNENLFKTYMVTVPEAGEGYIAFRTSSNQARVDNVVMDGTPVAVTVDIAYISQSVPSKFSLNKTKEVSVTYRNLLAEIPASGYKIEVVQDGQVLKTVDGTVALTTGNDVTIPTTVAFSTDGKHELSFNLVKDEESISSAVATVNVVDEGYDEIFQVGPSHTNNMLSDDWNSWPLTPQSTYAVTSEAIYPAALLQDINANGASATNGNEFDANAPLTGLKNGDKITSIGWIAYASVSTPNITSAELPVELYLENTTDETYTGTANNIAFKEVGDGTLKQVFKGTMVFDLTKTNSQRNKATAAAGTLVDMEEPIAKIILDEPFEYTGNNLRVQLRIPKVYFNQNSPVEGAEYFNWTTNNSSIAGQIMALDSKGTNTSDYRILYQSGATAKTISAQLPMLIMGKQVEAKKLTGTVSHSMTQNGLADVKVTASSAEGVAFSGLTDETGAYSIEIGNPDFDFTVTAEHTTSTKFHPYTSETTVNFAEGDVEHNITLNAKTVTVSGIVVDGKDAPVEGATVTLTTDENGELTATTTADGEFSFTTSDINSTLSLEVTKTGYSSYTDDAVDVEEADVELDDIVIFKNVTISGVVKDTRNELVGGATVTLTDEDGNDATTTSDSMGEFSFTDKEANKDYTLTVSKEGYDDANEPVSVEVDDKAVTITLYDEGTSYLSSISKDGVTVTPGFGQIRIEAAGKDVVVVDMAGHVVANYANLDGSVVVVVPAGIYVVNNTKVVVR
ncbi:MAG: carboxypeptidase regulatory-like domain-containing protein [Muribaculaceae bacterium]|nr:carboxypeptidase regulatory-like domain-containing protein [Muribaculaceae bacterium]